MSAQSDPYHPPSAELLDANARSHKLYSPTQIVVATFFGALIAGSWMFAENCRHLGQSDKRRLWLMLGAVGTLIMLALAIALPEDTPNMLLPVCSAMLMNQMVGQFQKAAFDEHMQAGGLKQSNWRVAGIGLCGMAITGVIVVLAVRLLPAGLVGGG